MVESANHLEAAIRELEDHLGKVENLDPASRQRLEDAVASIQAKLRTPGATPANWSSGLSSALVDLQTSHPGLATMVTRVCDFLDQAGV